MKSLIPQLLAVLVCVAALADDAYAGMDLYADLKPSESRTKTLVSQAKAAGFSRIIVSLSGGDGSVAWQTPLETYYPRLQGPLNSGHDALESLIRNCHEVGIEVVASVIVAEGGSITANNPQWATVNANGQTSTGIEFLGDTMSFAYPGARQAKVNVMMDLVNGYDIDGVFLDYTRYQYGFGYDPPVLDELQATYGFDARTVPVPPVGSPQQGTQQWRQFSELRAQHVQEFVEEFRDAVHQSSNPVSIGTFSDARWGMDLDVAHLGRNFPAWAQAGLVDEVWIGNYTETPINQIKNVTSTVRTAVGQDVRLSSALTTWNNHFTTKSQFLGAVREAFLGSADGLFLYREDFLVSNSLWDESTAANEKLNRFLKPSAGTTHASYEAATVSGPPDGGVGGWASDGRQMVNQGNYLLQDRSPLSVSRYKTTSVMPGLMNQTTGYYALDFTVRPLEDLNLSGGANMFNLHVQWADNQSLYNVVIDLDSNDGAAGTLGSINFGSSGTSKAISGIDWSSPRQVTIAFHSDDQIFYFYLDGEFVNHVSMSGLRIGNATPALQNTLFFGDSSDLSGDVSAEWYRVGVYGSVIPGDFDQDGDVDGRDFLVWQRGSASLYDAGDLADWKNNYGLQSSSLFTTMAVPEPMAGGLLIVGVITAFLAGRRIEK